MNIEAPLPRSRLAVAAAACALLALAGCGGDGGGSERRDAVDAYLARATGIAARHAVAFEQADAAFRDFASGRGGATLPRRLTTAAAAIGAAQREVRRLRAPAAARAVQRDLVRVYALEATLAREVAQTAAFLPDARRALDTLQAANAAFGKRVGGKLTPAQQAAALEEYAARVEPVAARLRALEPPPALAPWLAEQRAWLDGLRGSARSLAVALRGGEEAAVRARAESFRQQVARRPGVSSAQRRAIAAYDARLARVESLQRRIEREREDLQRELS